MNEPDCFTCQHCSGTNSGWYCSEHNLNISNRLHNDWPLAEVCDGDYREANSDE